MQVRLVKLSCQAHKEHSVFLSFMCFVILLKSIQEENIGFVCIPSTVYFSVNLP